MEAKQQQLFLKILKLKMKVIDRKERVVITGIGIVCPLGNDVDTMWKGILKGKSGVDKTTIFDASTFPTTFDAEVKDYDLSKHTKNFELHKDSDRGSAFVIGATIEACRQAKIDADTDELNDGIDRSRLGIYLGAGEGSVDNDTFFEAIAKAWNDEERQMNWAKWAEISFSKMNPMYELEQEPNMPVAHIAILTGARGPTRSCLTACAASTQAVGEAMKIIQRGDADVMIAGGAHSMIHPLGLTGFNRLTALSTRNDSPQTASRPFTIGTRGDTGDDGGDGRCRYQL
jgi:3-oxoacyl-[acyl-carrier-protein] synthase II